MTEPQPIVGERKALKVRGRLTKEEEARVAALPEHQQAKGKEYLLLKKMEKRDREKNPIGWYKPLPAQLEFHKDGTSKRLCTGGNRSGKTQAGTMELIWWCLGKHPYREVPRDVVGIVSSESFEVQRNTIIEQLQEWMPKNKTIQVIWNRENKVMIGPNGKVFFKSAEQGWRAFQGIALDFFWLDEEQDHEVFKQLSKRLKRGSSLQSWYTLTPEPDKSDHWTFDALAMPAIENRGDVAHFEFDLEDNRVSRGGFINDRDIDELIAMTPLEERPAVIHGTYVKRGGLIYPMWSRKDHVSAAKPIKHFLDGVRNGVFTPFCALDWGVRNPTALLLFVEDADENVHLIDEIYHPAKDVAQIKREYKERFAVFQPYFIVADPSIWSNHDSTDPERTIAGQLMRDSPGLPALPLIEADNDVVSGLAAVRELLRVDPVKGAKLKMQPRCVETIKEVQGYVGEEYVTGAHMRNKKETPKKHNDHAMDSLRYLSLSAHRHVKQKRFRVQPNFHISPVTGYMRAAG